MEGIAQVGVSYAELNEELCLPGKARTLHFTVNRPTYYVKSTCPLQTMPEQIAFAAKIARDNSMEALWHNQHGNEGRAKHHERLSQEAISWLAYAETVSDFPYRMQDGRWRTAEDVAYRTEYLTTREMLQHREACWHATKNDGFNLFV